MSVKVVGVTKTTTEPRQVTQKQISRSLPHPAVARQRSTFQRQTAE